MNNRSRTKLIAYKWLLHSFVKNKNRSKAISNQIMYHAINNWR